MAGVTYKCPSCGAYLNFDPDSQKWKCPFCSSVFADDAVIGDAAAQPEDAQQAAEEQAAAQEQRAKVIEAEAEVPKAMASALREGKLGVLDYYQMQNTIADTTMRESIAAMGDAGKAVKK